MNKANYLKTAGGLSVSGNGRREIYPVGSEKYDRGLALIREGKLDALYDLLWEDQKKIKVYAKEGFRVEDGVVYVNNDALPTTLGEYLVKLADEGFPCDPILKFWANVNENPSRQSALELFDFLTVYQHPITEDGCFIGYRRVTSDFKDFYSRTFDNSVGQVVKIAREKVDGDRNQGCSTGLHVANWNYAKNSYYAGSGHLVEVKVNPKNVVSVPLECEQQKIRVCEFEVLAVCEYERKDVLTDSRGSTYVSRYDDSEVVDLFSVADEDDYENNDEECEGCEECEVCGYSEDDCECDVDDECHDPNCSFCNDVDDDVWCDDCDSPVRNGECECEDDKEENVQSLLKSYFANSPVEPTVEPLRNTGNVTVNVENITFVFPPLTTADF